MAGFDWTGKSYPKYDPKTEGYGSASEWASTFNVRMGFKEAQEWKAKGTRTWGSDWQVINDIAELHNFAGSDKKCSTCGVEQNAHKSPITEKSIWDEVRKAFRVAAMKCHPDRMTEHGKSKIVGTKLDSNGNTVPLTQAEEEFKSVSAAYAMLEDIYRSQNRLK